MEHGARKADVTVVIYANRSYAILTSSCSASVQARRNEGLSMLDLHNPEMN